MNNQLSDLQTSCTNIHSRTYKAQIYLRTKSLSLSANTQTHIYIYIYIYIYKEREVGLESYCLEML